MPADGEKPESGGGDAANASARSQPPPAVLPGPARPVGVPGPSTATPVAPPSDAPPPLTDDALLASFFAEVRSADRDAEVDRVLGAFKLNPFEQVGCRFDATDAEVTRAYRKVREKRWREREGARAFRKRERREADGWMEKPEAQG